MTLSIWIAGIAVLITFSTFLANVIFRSGHVTGALETRVSALEAWRGTIRFDMHEISDKMEALVVEMKALHTLIEERTERRAFTRPPTGPPSS